MNFSFADIKLMVRIATQRTGAPVHDEDLEQEASLRAVEAFQRRTDVRYPRAFLMKIVHDTVSDHWRRRRSLEDLASIDETRLGKPCTFEDDIDRRRQGDVLRAAIATLDSRKRATIELFYTEGRTVGEIARLQNKSQSAVKMDLLRSRRALAQIVVTLRNKKSR